MREESETGINYVFVFAFKDIILLGCVCWEITQIPRYVRWEKKKKTDKKIHTTQKINVLEIYLHPSSYSDLFF